MFYMTDNIPQNIPHTHVECGKICIILYVPHNIALGLNNIMLREYMCTKTNLSIKC